MKGRPFRLFCSDPVTSRAQCPAACRNGLLREPPHRPVPRSLCDAHGSPPLRQIPPHFPAAPSPEAAELPDAPSTTQDTIPKSGVGYRRAGTALVPSAATFCERRKRPCSPKGKNGAVTGSLRAFLRGTQRTGPKGSEGNGARDTMPPTSAPRRARRIDCGLIAVAPVTQSDCFPPHKGRRAE